MLSIYLCISGDSDYYFNTFHAGSVAWIAYAQLLHPKGVLVCCLFVCSVFAWLLLFFELNEVFEWILLYAQLLMVVVFEMNEFCLCFLCWLECFCLF